MAGTPPQFVRASEFPGYAAGFLDPSPLFGLPPATPAADEALLERRTNAYDALQSHYYQAPPRIER
ncbi:hypothetical protein, partial [Arthrobacter koreensis]|uniref:hypothetical protein n=1 Tax=Arthrobacter koreensis TaxID=199136 RepID=UPI00240A4052